jgi:hypothetical protein
MQGSFMELLLHDRRRLRYMRKGVLVGMLLKQLQVYGLLRLLFDWRDKPVNRLQEQGEC